MTRQPRKTKNFEFYEFLQIVNERLNNGIEKELARGLHNFVVEWLKLNGIDFDYSYLNEFKYDDRAGRVFSVESLKGYVNLYLESAIREQIEKRMAASMLEDVLHLTKNYRGYNHIKHIELDEEWDRVYY